MTRSQPGLVKYRINESNQDPSELYCDLDSEICNGYYFYLFMWNYIHFMLPPELLSDRLRNALGCFIYHAPLLAFVVMSVIFLFFFFLPFELIGAWELPPEIECAST